MLHFTTPKDEEGDVRFEAGAKRISGTDWPSGYRPPRRSSDQVLLPQLLVVLRVFLRDLDRNAERLDDLAGRGGDSAVPTIGATAAEHRGPIRRQDRPRRQPRDSTGTTREAHRPPPAQPGAPASAARDRGSRRPASPRSCSRAGRGPASHASIGHGGLPFVGGWLPNCTVSATCRRARRWDGRAHHPAPKPRPAVHRPYRHRAAASPSAKGNQGMTTADRRARFLLAMIDAAGLSLRRWVWPRTSSGGAITFMCWQIPPSRHRPDRLVADSPLGATHRI